MAEQWPPCQSISLTFLLIFVMYAIDSGWSASPSIIGFVPVDGTWVRFENDKTFLTAEEKIPLRLLGDNLSPSQTEIQFTSAKAERGGNCDGSRSTQAFESTDGANGTVVVTVQMNKKDVDEGTMYMCVSNGGSYVHQGTQSWLSITVEKKPVKKTLLPIWLQIIFILLCLCLSGLFSGLNLGLMSLDKTELKIVENCGSSKEKKYAKIISPLRKRGNFLLCTILLGNVLVNNTLTILMDDLTGSGGAAIVAATIGIVIFGEIIPQAVCSRHGLAIGARTAWITRFFMVLTFPLSFPISKILDCVLGEEIGNVYNRDRLRELLKVTEGNLDLVKDEFNIIAGALELSKKTVIDVMTKIEDVYMLEYDAVLDFETMNEIMKTGYTRVPIFEKERSNIVALLNIKDLAFVDPDDRTPLKTVCKFYDHPVNHVYDDTKLDVMLEEFKKGRSHMSFVQRVNTEGEGDPFYETIGLVTLEDVIEEIIQCEIVDETDTITDNRKKAQRSAQIKDFSVFHQPDELHTSILSPQLALATYQFLSTSVVPFKPECISESVLQRLIKKDIVIDLRVKDPQSANTIIYKRGQPSDYFVLILQGNVQVEVGKENMIFQGGPFMYFGTQALAGPSSTTNSKSLSITSISSDAGSTRQTSYVPDFTVRATGDVMYLQIRRAHYMAAYRATLMQREPKTPEVDSTEDVFSKEWSRAISVTRDGCNNVRANSADAQNGSKTSPSVTSPSTPDRNIASKAAYEDKQDKPGDESESNLPSPHGSGKSKDSSNQAAPLIKNCEEQDGKGAVS